MLTHVALAKLANCNPACLFHRDSCLTSTGAAIARNVQHCTFKFSRLFLNLMLILRRLTTVNPLYYSHVYLLVFSTSEGVAAELLDLTMSHQQVLWHPLAALMPRCLSHNCHTCLRYSLSMSHVLRQSLRKAGIIINSQQHCADTGIHLDSFT